MSPVSLPAPAFTADKTSARGPRAGVKDIGNGDRLTTVSVDVRRCDAVVRQEDVISAQRLKLIRARATHVELAAGAQGARYLHLVFTGSRPTGTTNRSPVLLSFSDTGQRDRDAFPLVVLANSLEDALRQHSENKGLIAHIALALRAGLPGHDHDTRSASPPSGLAEWQLRRALVYMEEHFGQPIRIPDVAAACALSHGHFARAFQVSTGKSPYRWLLERRVEAACQLLSTTDMALTEVGLACGFAEQSHFTRIFRSSMGMPPGTWRRSRTSFS